MFGRRCRCAGTGWPVVACVLSLLSLLPSIASAAEQPEITAEYAVVIDASDGQVLFDKGMNTRVAPASLTKVFTALAALESASLDSEYTVDQYDLVGEASMGLQAGDRLSLRTLLYGMMLPSGNDAATVIARNVAALLGDSPQQSINRFMDRVNAMNQRLGLQDTHLVNPHGLDQPDHYSSARDLAAITMYALRNPEFRQIFGAPYYQAEGYQLYQVNQLLNSYPGLIGGKTGITDEAGYCLIEAAQLDGKTVISVSLKSTSAAWYADATALLDHGFDVLAAGTVPADLPKISLAPPTTVPAASVASNNPVTATELQVDRIDPHTAVVRHADLPLDSRGLPWRWPIVSLLSMVAALGLVMNYPALLGLGSIVWQRRRPLAVSTGLLALNAGTLFRGAPTRRRRPVQRRTVTSGNQPRRRPFPPTVDAIDRRGPTSLSVDSGRRARQPVNLNVAETFAQQAIRLANRGNYHAATSEFARALRIDATFDLTRSPGFWALEPAGYLAAARAYAQIDRTADAKPLLTVVKLSCGSNRDLERLLTEVVVASP